MKHLRYFSLVAVTMLIGISSKAQNFSTYVGGANGLIPCLIYEQTFFGDYGSPDPGVRLSVGMGYWKGYKQANFGVAGSLGKKKTLEMGMDYVQPFRFEGDTYSVERYIYCYLGVRFGPGRVSGFGALGPLFVQHKVDGSYAGGTTLDISMKAGLSVRVFRTAAQRKAKREEKRKTKGRFNWLNNRN